MPCKLTRSLDNRLCAYVAAGMAPGFYLANYYPPVVSVASEPVAVADKIVYKYDVDGYITDMILPEDEVFYKVLGSDDSVSYLDELLAGANGAKYRQHTLNAIMQQNDLAVLKEGDAISLGTFVAVAIDKGGIPRLLGRTNGIKAPAGGFNYNSGAAIADAMGWTLQLQGVSMEIAPILKDDTVITPIFEEVVIP